MKLLAVLILLLSTFLVSNAGFTAGVDDPQRDLTPEQKERSHRSSSIHLHFINRTQSKDKCAPAGSCDEGLILPVWEPTVSPCKHLHA